MEANTLTNLPHLAYTAQQVQENEAEAALHSGADLTELMQRAGRSAFNYIDKHIEKNRPLIVLTGKGNNAGDGFVVAYFASVAGYQVSVQACFSPHDLKGDAADAYQRFLDIGGTVLDVDEHLATDKSAYYVDAVFGTGFYGELPNHIQRLFARLNESSIECLALDVPSGVNATSGVASCNTLRAQTTIVFIALKQGLLTGQGKVYSGNIMLADLDIHYAFNNLVSTDTLYLDQKRLLAMRPKRSLDCYKNQLGHVLLIGGNKGMAGAIRLASEACLRAGAGLVSVATHPDNVNVILQGRYELMVHGVQCDTQLQPHIDKADVIVIGPGLGQDAWAQQLFCSMAAVKKVIVCDADGLNLLADTELKSPHLILTPHLGEARRLCKGRKIAVETFEERFALVSKLSEAYKACVVLKGPGSLVCHQSRININRSGTSAMASAGMGDVLSGIIGGLVAQKMDVFEATCLAVYIHGLAAEIAAQNGAKGLLAGDLFEHIRSILE